MIIDLAAIISYCEGYDCASLSSSFWDGDSNFDISWIFGFISKTNSDWTRQCGPNVFSFPVLIFANVTSHERLGKSHHYFWYIVLKFASYFSQRPKQLWISVPVQIRLIYANSQFELNSFERKSDPWSVRKSPGNLMIIADQILRIMCQIVVLSMFGRNVAALNIVTAFQNVLDEIFNFCAVKHDADNNFVI